MSEANVPKTLQITVFEEDAKLKTRRGKTSRKEHQTHNEAEEVTKNKKITMDNSCFDVTFEYYKLC